MELNEIRSELLKLREKQEELWGLLWHFRKTRKNHWVRKYNKST